MKSILRKVNLFGCILRNVPGVEPGVPQKGERVLRDRRCSNCGAIYMYCSACRWRRGSDQRYTVDHNSVGQERRLPSLCLYRHIFVVRAGGGEFRAEELVAWRGGP